MRLIYLTGHAGMTIDDIRNFRQLHSPAAGHPEHGEHPAIETTTGPLGQGIATAVGMALAERMLAARFGKSLVDHRTWVIASDGDMMEGINHEAGALAGHLCLSKLTVLYDDNHVSIDGDTALSFSDDVAKRYSAYGWATKHVDGHDPAQVAAALVLRGALEKADADRVPHHHRPGRAAQGGHRPRCTARRWGRRKPRAPRLRWTGMNRRSPCRRTCWSAGTRSVRAAPRRAGPG